MLYFYYFSKLDIAKLKLNIGRQMKYLPLIFFFCVISAFTTSTSAHPVIINIPKSVYKGDNKNWDIKQDEQGYIYFANDIGLLQYDGIEWDLYSLPNQTVVRSVAVASNKTIYRGSFEEFGRWDRDLSGELVYTSLSENLDQSIFKNEDIWRISITDTHIYFQSFASIFVYDYHTVERVSMGQGFLFLSKVNDRLIVPSINGALYWMEGKKLTKIEGSEIFKDTDVRIILPYSEDKEQFMVGTSTKGFYIFDGKTFSKMNIENKVLEKANPNCGLRSSDGTYYIGTLLDGVFQIDEDGKLLEHISTDNYLNSNTVLSIYEDNANDIWLGLDGGIAFAKNVERLNFYTYPTGGIGSVYDAVIWQGNLLLATNQRVYYIPYEELNKPYVASNFKALPNTEGQVWNFKIVGDKVYCGHNAGVLSIDKQMRVERIDGIGTGVFKIDEAQVGNSDVLLLATYSSLNMMDKATGKITVVEEPKQPIYNMNIDHLNNVWLEHPEKGIFRCRFDHSFHKFESMTHYGGFNDDNLPYNLKIFKLGGRIEVYGENQFYHYDEISDKLVPNEILNKCLGKLDIRQVVQISSTYFWGLGRHSLVRFFYDGYQARLVENFNLGAELSLVNNFENLSILNDSTQLICLENGFALYVNNNPELDTMADVIPPPLLQMVAASDNKKNIEYQDPSIQAEVDYLHNNFAFKFMAQNVFNKNLSFQYWLKNVDNTWSAVQKTNKVLYERLPVGEYEFQVRTVDAMGRESAVTSYYFTIKTPWFLTFWALSFYTFLILLFFYGIWLLLLRRWRNAHIRKIRKREIARLRLQNKELKDVVESKDAELFTLTSFIVGKNELILNMKDLVLDFYEKKDIKGMLPLTQQIQALLNQSLDTEDDWKMFLVKFEEKHSTFFKNLKAKFPELTNNDLRLCACLKLNMDTKEIASLLSVSIRSVENNRYRLRKKLALEPSQNLNEYLISIN